MKQVTTRPKQLNRHWHRPKDHRYPFNFLKNFSLEWDYCMIHDHQQEFTGSIGYVLVNPEWNGEPKSWIQRLKFLPQGASIAIAGQFKDGRKIAEFINFDDAEISEETRSLQAHNQDNGLQATVHLGDDNVLSMYGITHDIEYKLNIAGWWPERMPEEGTIKSPFTPVCGQDMGIFPTENWMVDIIWPRTTVSGFMRDLKKNTILDIKGHGYRENAFGQWLFFTGGWDFGAFSDSQSGVELTLQTYHHSKQLSYLDVRFPLDDHIEQFRLWAKDKELEWHHNGWQFDQAANRHLPLDTQIFGCNENYIVEASMTINDRYATLLYDKCLCTKVYVIFALFPWFTGSIYRKSNGRKILEFSGQGGGEYSNVRLPI